jgi:hypothetical protein
MENPFLLCRCGSQIWLPIASSAQLDATPWPLHRDAQAFLCGSCFTVQMFKPSDLKWEELFHPLLIEQLKTSAIFELSFPCIEPKCNSRYEIHVVIEQGSQDAGLLKRLTRFLQMSNVFCASGLHHLSSIGGWTGGNLSFEEDLEWSRSRSKADPV